MPDQDNFQCSWDFLYKFKIIKVRDSTTHEAWAPHRNCVNYIDLKALWKLTCDLVMICHIITRMLWSSKSLKKVLKFSLSFQIKLQDQPWCCNDISELAWSLNVVSFVWFPLLLQNKQGVRMVSEVISCTALNWPQVLAELEILELSSWMVEQGAKALNREQILFRY